MTNTWQANRVFPDPMSADLIARCNSTGVLWARWLHIRDTPSRDRADLWSQHAEMGLLSARMVALGDRRFGGAR